MAVGRVSSITGIATNPDSTLATSTVVTAQLASSLAGASSLLFSYFVTGDPANGEIIQFTPVSVTSDAVTAAFALSLTAPVDIVQSDYLGNHLSNTYYVISTPGGIQVTTTAFAYSALARDIALVSAASAATPYTTANVTFQNVIPSQTGSSVVVQASLNTAGSIGGVFIATSPPFQVVLNNSGVGTLALPPNDQISPAGTYYNVSFNGGPTYAISVPTAGGAFLNLLTTPLASGSLSANGVIPAGAYAYYTTKYGRQTLGAFHYFV